jgi:hypothetical protein
MNPPQPNPPPHALPPLSPPPYDEENPLPTEENDPVVGFRQMIRDTNAAHRWDALNQQMAQSARYLFMQATSHYHFLRTLFGMGTTLFVFIRIAIERGAPQEILVSANKSLLAVYVYASFFYNQFRVTFAAFKDIVCVRESHRLLKCFLAKRRW